MAGSCATAVVVAIRDYHNKARISSFESAFPSRSTLPKSESIKRQDEATLLTTMLVHTFAIPSSSLHSECAWITK